MAHPDILVEVDEQEGTRWLTYNGNHYPFADSGKELYVENVDPQDFQHGLMYGFVADNEEYQKFKARQQEKQL